jgi:glycerate 2-kinase
VLVAFDKFKGALDAERACDVAAEVIRSERPGWSVDVAPLTDGGEGFCRIMTQAAGGVLHARQATGPLFDGSGRAPRLEAQLGVVELRAVPEAARARLGLSPRSERLAVVDMASVNGLVLVQPAQRDVYRSCTRGTGELLLAARELGVDAILLGVGGSATSDLGLGALAALGWRFETAAGETLAPPIPACWERLERVVPAAPGMLPPLRIACDVDNPLLGPRGAAAVYGPQKGLAPSAVAAFDVAAERVAALVCAAVGAGPELTTAPGAGAAGGIAFGLNAAVGARLVPGSALVDAWLGLEARVAAADWVLTGEGRFDASSWAGKGPGALVRAAQRRGRRWAVFAGSIALGRDARRRALGEGGQLVAITERGEPIAPALARTAENLARSVRAWLSTL